MLDIIRANAQSWGVKIAFGLIIIVFVFWGVGSFQASDSTVILKVNGTPIMEQDFVLRYRPQLDAIRMQYPNLTQDDLKNIEPELRKRVLQTLVMEALLGQESARTGVIVTPQELRRTIEQIPAFHNDKGKFDPDTYVRVLQTQNTMPGVFEEQVRNDLLVKKFQQVTSAAAFVPMEQGRDLFRYQVEQRVLDAIVFKTADYLAQATPTAEEIGKFYESNKADFQVPAQVDVQYVNVSPQTLAASEKVEKADVEAYYAKNQEKFRRPERVRARHILVLAPKDADKATDDAAKANIEGAAAQIRSGKDFAEVAKAVSQDGSAQDGGELGWFSRGQMVPEFEEASFALKPGELSAPIRSQFGWHLIRVDERTPADIVPMAEVEEDITHTLAVERATPKVQELLDSLLIAVINGQSLTDAATKYHLVPVSTGLQDEAALSQQMGLKPADVKLLMAAPAGKTLDSAFSTGEGYVIAHVTTSEPAKTQPLDAVRADIEAQLRDQKALRLAEQAATAARATITGNDVPEALKPKLVVTPPMDRDGFATGFVARNQRLGAAVFAAKGKTWLDSPYVVEEGAALIRLKDIIEPDDKAWQQVETQLMRALNNAKQEKQYLSFLNGLSRSAKIEEINVARIENREMR